MGLFDLIKQNQAVGPATDFLSEFSFAVIACGNEMISVSGAY